MPNDLFRVAVIGAGETGTPLLRKLLAAPFVELLGVADSIRRRRACALPNTGA